MSQDTKPLQQNKIFLLSEITDLPKITNSDEHEIIAFDYDTHKILKKSKIIHSLADNFLDESELLMINTNSVKFSKWYKQTYLNDLIYFNEINLGELFESQLQHYLVSFLINFIEIKNIFNLNPNAIYHASEPIYKILKLFTNDIILIESSISHFSILPSKISKSKNHYLSLDTNFLPSFFISALENILKKFVNNKLTSNQKTILMVNFTTRKNKSFLLNFKNSKLNLIKFDRILPAIWNIDSFFTIKKSNCIPEHYSSLIDSQIKDQIHQNVSSMEKIINLIFENDDLSKYFVLDGISFWNIIKHDLKNFFKNNLFQSMIEIHLTQTLFQKYNFSNILILNESGRNEKIAMHFAKKTNTSISCLEHGLLCPIQQDLDNFLGGFPVLSDNFFTWGKITKQNFESIRVSSTKSISTGSPFYDHIHSAKNQTSDYILVASAGLGNYTSFDQTVTARINYENSLIKICEIATKLEKKLIVKIHPGLYLNEESIIKKINPKIKVIKSGSILKLLKSCSFLIALGPTSAILESLVSKKPTICVPLNPLNCNILFKNYEELLIPLSQIDEIMQLFFSNSDYKNSLLKSGESFLEDYLVNHGTAGLILIEYLKNN